MKLLPILLSLLVAVVVANAETVLLGCDEQIIPETYEHLRRTVVDYKNNVRSYCPRGKQLMVCQRYDRDGYPTVYHHRLACAFAFDVRSVPSFRQQMTKPGSRLYVACCNDQNKVDAY